jgi:hypothetical protein
LGEPTTWLSIQSISAARPPRLPDCESAWLAEKRLSLGVPVT